MWTEEEHNSAIRAFQNAHPEWDVVSNQTRCPICARQCKYNRKGIHFCSRHRWASRSGLNLFRVAMLSLHDPRLKEELEKVGITLRSDESGEEREMEDA